jgi:hypothetical protein
MHPHTWLSTVGLAVAAAAYAALLAGAVPAATAAPATDAQGYLDSTARCTTPDKAVAFGSTATSRVAICQKPDGSYEYRGVRLRDGAKLIVAATRSGDGGYVAASDGITYTVTASSLVVSAGSQVLRREPMLDYHAPEVPTSATASAAPSTTASSTAPPPAPSSEVAPAPPSPPPGPPSPAEKGYSGG